MTQRPGPAWLGIGAQRSGTTWFCDLLLQHPDVTLPAPGRKELHHLYGGLRQPLDIDMYRRWFDGTRLAGEFTPYYLRALWAPPVAVEVLQPDAPVLVLLRDPVERFASSMRLEATRTAVEDGRRGDRMLGSDAQWAGMYATQLEAWAKVVGRERLVVMQYEQVIQDPQRWVNRVWERLGLPPVQLSGTELPSSTSSGDAVWHWPTGLRDALRRAYEDQVDRLAAWGIDRSLWRNFA